MGATTGSTLTLGVAGTPTAAPFAIGGTLTANGTTTLNVVNTGSPFSLGQFPLLSFTGSIGGAGYSSFVVGALPARVVGSLVNDTANSSIDLDVTAVATIYWTGATSGNWDIGTLDGSGNPATGTQNWATNSVGAATVYLQNTAPGDTVTFDDRATSGNYNITLTTTVQPASITVNNSINAYVLSGPGSIAGSGSLTKSGTASLTLDTANTYTGPTNLVGPEPGSLGLLAVGLLGLLRRRRRN